MAFGYANIAKMITKATPTKLDFNGYDVGMMVQDVGLALAGRYADQLSRRHNEVIKHLNIL